MSQLAVHCAGVCCAVAVVHRYTTFYLTRGSLTYSAPSMVADPNLGFTLAHIGTMTSIFPMAYGVSKFAAGRLATCFTLTVASDDCQMRRCRPSATPRLWRTFACAMRAADCCYCTLNSLSSRAIMQIGWCYHVTPIYADILSGSSARWWVGQITVAG